MHNVLAKLSESLPKFDFMKSVLYHSHGLDYLIVFEFMNIYLYVIMTHLVYVLLGTVGHTEDSAQLLRWMFQKLLAV